MAARTYCSEANVDEPMLGTADVVDIWLLLEYRPVWEAKAITNNRLSAKAGRWLTEGMAALRELGHRVRPQFVRQPEIDRSDARLFVHHEGALREFGSESGDYHGLIQTPLATLVQDGALGTPVAVPQYFVCTNGRRDLCCARFGLPAYAKLRELVGERAWQTTHLGGHRFAPNVLVLPQGALYGRVVPEDIVSFVGQVESGGMPVSKLRGRSRYPKPVQAAEAFIGRLGLEFVDVEGEGPSMTVNFTDGSKSLAVAVRESTEPLWVTASCGDEQQKAVYPYLCNDDR